MVQIASPPFRRDLFLRIEAVLPKNQAKALRSWPLAATARSENVWQGGAELREA
jgi:hypothetical protein